MYEKVPVSPGHNAARLPRVPLVRVKANAPVYSFPFLVPLITIFAPSMRSVVVKAADPFAILSCPDAIPWHRADERPVPETTALPLVTVSTGELALK